MKMNLIDGHAVDLRLGCRQRRKNFAASGFDSGVELRAFDQIANLFPRARRFLLRACDLKLRGAERVNGLFSRPDIESQRRDFLELGSEAIKRQAQVEQCADKHVATDAPDEISVGYSHRITLCL